MNRASDDPKSRTSDLRVDISDPDKDIATQVFDPSESAVETVEMSDSDQDRLRADQGSSKPPSGQIGGYKILRRLGEGGMGIVYEAEQQQPKRLVALKFIRGGQYASDSHVRMFEREVQALARLKHPGIVSIYEAGRFDDGQVFFSMELVNGRSLLEFTDGRDHTAATSISASGKLRLFEQICSVVSYAHQRGVIHRDLKPQNVLVMHESETNSFSDPGTEGLKVKVLDFGLARITDPEMVGATDLSQVGQIKGTLNYMSPEQLTGVPDDIDVRSDVYSLGVILYELLTGRLPYDLKKLSIPEAMRVIAEKPPEPMVGSSSRISSRGSRSSTRVDREIETIVQKALEKEPARRYQSVAAMMEDVVRYRSNQPILARPPSAAYQFRKLVARHKVLFAGAASLFLILVTFAAVMAAQSARLAAERDRAIKAEQIADEQRRNAENAQIAEQRQRQLAEENLERAEEQKLIVEKEKSEAERAKNAEAEQRKIAESNFIRANSEQKRAEQQADLAEQQRSMAQAQKHLAERRQIEAEEQKNIAKEQTEEKRMLLYFSEVNRALNAWLRADVPTARKSLLSQIPSQGESDLRNFEWHYIWELSDQHEWEIDLGSDRANVLFAGDLIIGNVAERSDDSLSVKMIGLDPTTKGRLFEIQNRFAIGSTPDGKVITSPFPLIKRGVNDDISWNSSIDILDPETLQVTPTGITLPENVGVPHLMVLRNGNLILFRETGTEIWSIESGRMLHSLPAINSYPSAALSADGTVAALADGQKVTLLDAEGDQTIMEIGSEGDFIEGVGLSDKGDRLIIGLKRFVPTGNQNTRLELWDVPSRRRLQEIHAPPPDGLILDRRLADTPYTMSREIVFSPDGKSFMEIKGPEVRLYKESGTRPFPWNHEVGHPEIPASEVIFYDMRLLRGHGVDIGSAIFSPDGKRILTSDRSGLVKLWAVRDITRKLRDGRDVSLSLDGNLVASSVSRSIELTDTRNDVVVGNLGHLEEVGTWVGSPKISPDNARVAFVRNRSNESVDGTWQDPEKVAELWDIAANERLASFEKGISRPMFSPDGRYLAVVNNHGKYYSPDSDVNLRDAKTGEFIETLGKGRFVNFSPDGKIIAVATESEIRLVDSETLQVIGRLVRPRGLGSFLLPERIEVVFTSDSNRLAAIDGPEISIWDIGSLEEIGRLTGNHRDISSVSFSPDMRRIVTTSERENIITFWDASTFVPIVSFEANEPKNAIFTGEGNSLVVETQIGWSIIRTRKDLRLDQTKDR